MPNQPRPENRHRMVRVEDELWQAAKTTAANQGTTVSEVIREALRRFVNPADMSAAIRHYLTEQTDISRPSFHATALTHALLFGDTPSADG